MVTAAVINIPNCTFQQRHRHRSLVVPYRFRRIDLLDSVVANNFV